MSHKIVNWYKSTVIKDFVDLESFRKQIRVNKVLIWKESLGSEEIHL